MLYFISGSNLDVVCETIKKFLESNRISKNIIITQKLEKLLINPGEHFQFNLSNIFDRFRLVFPYDYYRIDKLLSLYLGYMNHL